MELHKYHHLGTSKLFMGMETIQSLTSNLLAKTAVHKNYIHDIDKF